MKAEEDPCTRRELLATAFGQAAAAGASLLSGYTEPLREAVLAAGAPWPAGRPSGPAPGGFLSYAPVRPPGAVAEDRFLELCARCGSCVRACPGLVIRKAAPEYGARLEGSPMLLPAEDPCLFCEGLPCAAACGTGALVPPPAGSRARIGLAVVDAARCFSGQGQPCAHCVKACPARPRAVSVPAGSSALVDAAACLGCGVCAQGCPADAITIRAMR